MSDEYLIGIDAEEISRIEPLMTSRIFTKAEKELFEEKKAGAAMTAAANFCAKEAVLKALGDETDKKLSPSPDLAGFIEVLRKPSGKPYIRLLSTLEKYEKEYAFDISLTHTKKTAAAAVIAHRLTKKTFSEEKAYPQTLIKKREQNSHKGTFGALELHCGSRKMTGAAILCATAALRSGVGLLYMPLPTGVRKIVQQRLCEPVFSESTRATALVVGCGLTVRRAKILKKLKKRNLPMVVDADAITYLSQNMNILERGGNEKLVLTPHPLEFARLLCRGKENASDFVPKTDEERKKAASDFAVKYGLTLLLKGHRTVVAAADGRVYVNETGNSGLAKGGSGDVLSGVLGSLLAQGYACYEAAVLAAWLHGKAAEKTEFSQSSLLPSDLCVEIGKLLDGAAL